ncbi:NAD(P)H-dependent oxidoreductase subunit E [Sulfurimonas sp.]|uniref:NADH-quinone oxidoreductase subunit NuoE family protein n=1 Tax=Sulfurimonas sp. TaxID=2022749 RepID=UPI0025F0BF3E|nr:NAD(P)H-dependent oxidoreductase subunit E [Sulfurimonas sp.]
MSEFKFSQENEDKFNELLKRYPEKASLSLPSLWMIQYQIGWISPESMVFLAKRLDTSPIDIQSIASFYTMFNLKPIGTYHIQVCKTLSCNLRGSKIITQHVQNRLGIKVGETTKDMKFTLSEVECLGSCGTAPMISFNHDYEENLTIEKVDKLIDEAQNA